MSSYFITGATGYIGSMLVKSLLQSNKDIVITAAVRDVAKAKGMLPAEVQLLQLDLTDRAAVAAISGSYDYVIHCASVTKSAEMVARPLSVVESIVNGTQNVMDLSVRCRAKSVLYISSMEVYGAVTCAEGQRVAEDSAGDGRVEVLSARSCYPLAKRMAENICYGYYKEHGLPVKIARLAQTFGKGVLPGDNRVFAQLARCVREGQDIILHTTGRSYGNYCEIEDALEGMLTILRQGKDGEAYNVVNEECTMMIGQMAQLVAEQVAGGAISVRYDIPTDNVYGYAADTGLKLSAEKLRALGWSPKKGLIEMYEDMLACEI